MVNIIAIFIFLLVLGLSINTVRSAENYNSSKSNTVTSVAKVHEYVGNILLPYGVGGMEINRVNDALDVGITADALKVMLGEILGNVGLGTASGEGVSDKVQAILLEFDKIGIGEDIPQSAIGKVIDVNPPKTDEASAPDAGGAVPRAIGSETKREEREREGLPSKQAEPVPVTTRQLFNPKEYTIERSIFQDASKNSIQNIRSAAPEERANLIDELQASRKTFQTEILSMNLSIRENAKTLRDNFRENMRTTIGHVDHGKTARLVLAHGKGLRMVNRYRSAIARFDHILGRLESRIEKIGIEIEAQARSKEGKVKEIYPPDNLVILIEEAKNTQILNKAKLVELEAKYESLLEVINVDSRGGSQARAIAKELKSEIEKLHGQLRAIADEIKQSYKNYKSSLSNTESK